MTASGPDDGAATIRRLRESEVRTLVEDLWLPFSEEMAALDRYEALADDVDVVAEAVAYRERRLRDDDAAHFVAERARRLAGYVHVEHRAAPPVFARGDEAHVVGLYVRPADRGDGVASALLTRAERWAGERDCEYVTLSVGVDNAAARGLYDDRGYEPFRERRRRRLE